MMTEDQIKTYLKRMSSYTDKQYGLEALRPLLQALLDGEAVLVPKSYKNEVVRLTEALAKANEGFEHYERMYYLTLDRLEEYELREQESDYR